MSYTGSLTQRIAYQISDLVRHYIEGMKRCKISQHVLLLLPRHSSNTFPWSFRACIFQLIILWLYHNASCLSRWANHCRWALQISRQQWRSALNSEQKRPECSLCQFRTKPTKVARSTDLEEFRFRSIKQLFIILKTVNGAWPAQWTRSLTRQSEFKGSRLKWRWIL